MKRERLNYLKRILTGLFISIWLVLPALAETDANPNSPTPILLSAPDSTRALAMPETGKSLRGDLAQTANNSYELYSKVALYITNIQLLNGEGASAFRVYAKDARGRRYQFPVLNLKLVDRQNRIYVLIIEIKDKSGYWEQPPEKGDVLVSVAWRGLESNRVRLGLGATGGAIEDDAGAVPTPFSAKTNNKSKEEIEVQNYVGYRWSGDRIRFLEQATFGPTDALDRRVQRIGLRTWLAEQFEAPYPSIPYPNFSLRPTTVSSDCDGQSDGSGNPDPDPFCFANHYTMYPVQNWFYKEAFYGDAQLRHRVAWALAQMWVISGIDTQQSSHMTAYHKVLSRNAFGNWRNLMREMTLNPGMGDYLNMRTSTKFSPNENYAREVLQLFNVGLFMLDNQGRVIIDQNTNQPIPTYDQDTVNNFTLVLTGWNLCEVSGAQCPNRLPGAPNFIDPMIITNPNNHYLEAKTLLNYPGSTTTNVSACTGCTGTAITAYANNSLNQALNNIYNHPNVAPFVSKFLIQQLVTGDPTPAYVGRIAAVFNLNRNSPTQMKEVVKAILLDPEARGDAKTDSQYGKLREPVQLLTNIARHFDVRSADRSVLSDGVVTTETASMGQIAFMSPTVFNFYPPDYIVPGTSFNGPEFALFTTGTAIARANFGNTIIFNRININANRRVTSGTSTSLAEMQALAAADASGNTMLDALNTKMMHGTMSAQMRNAIRTVILTVPESNPLLRAQRAVYLIATSSQYQVQR